jgi:hypothetical protein
METFSAGVSETCLVSLMTSFSLLLVTKRGKMLGLDRTFWAPLTWNFAPFRGANCRPNGNSSDLLLSR